MAVYFFESIARRSTTCVHHGQWLRREPPADLQCWDSAIGPNGDRLVIGFGSGGRVRSNALGETGAIHADGSVLAIGTAGADSLVGGATNDGLFGGPGANNLNGGAGDFDGDGEADILRRNDTTQQTAVREMDGQHPKAAPSPRPSARRFAGSDAAYSRPRCPVVQFPGPTERR